MNKYVLFICNQHSAKQHDMIRMSMKALSERFENEDLIIVSPAKYDVTYLQPVFPNAKFFTDADHIGSIKDRQPYMMYSFMFGGKDRIDNQHRAVALDWPAEFMELVDTATTNFKLKYFIVDPIEVDPRTFIDDTKIERFYYVPELDNGARECRLNHMFMYEHFPFDLKLRSNVGKKNAFTTVLGMTAYNKQRVNQCKEIEDFLYNCIERYKFGHNADVQDTRFPYAEYMDLLKQSKTTFILPSYDVNTFSIARVIEAVKNGCLPILLYGSNYSMYEKHFPGFYKMMSTLSYDINNENHRDFLAKFLEDDNAIAYAFDKLLHTDFITYCNSPKFKIDVNKDLQ